MLADHPWSTRRPFEGATRCDKSYVQFLLLSTSDFFPNVFWGENFTADLSDLPTFRCSLCAALDFWKLYAGALAPLALSGCQHLLFPCPCRPLRWPALWTDQWILLQTLDCASHLSMCRLKRTSKIISKSIQLHSQSVPNFDSSYYLLLARFCWLHKLYNISSHAPAHYLLTSERSAAPSLRFFMGGVMKSGRFVPSSFSPCALTQLPKNMPVAQQAQWFGCMSEDFWRWMAQTTRKISCMSFLKILRPVAVSSRPELTNPGLHTTANHELDSAQLFLTMCVWTGTAQHTVLTVFPFVAQLLRDVELSSKVSI